MGATVPMKGNLPGGRGSPARRTSPRKDEGPDPRGAEPTDLAMGDVRSLGIGSCLEVRHGTQDGGQDSQGPVPEDEALQGVQWEPVRELWGSPPGREEEALRVLLQAVQGGRAAQGGGVWWVRYSDADGKEHREKVGSKGAALEVYHKRKNQVREGTFFPGDVGRQERKPTIRDVVERYLEAHAANRSRKTDIYHADLLRDAFGDVVAEDLPPEDLRRWLAQRSDEKSPSTANRSLGFLRRACRLAVVDDILKFDPTSRVRAAKEPSGRVRWLKDDEEERLREAVADPWDWEIIEFAFQTGMRRGGAVRPEVG